MMGSRGPLYTLIMEILLCSVSGDASRRRPVGLPPWSRALGFLPFQLEQNPGCSWGDGEMEITQRGDDGEI